MIKTHIPIAAINMKNQSAHRSDLPMCFTSEAIAQIAETIGKLPPETGAKMWGPLDRLGVTHIEFDFNGSARAGGAVYAPDVEWGNERVAFWLQQDPPTLWSGDVHSHPGSMFRPSGKAGPGLGDLGYAEAVFEANESMQFFMMPIVLPCTSHCSQAEIAPWIVSRDTPLSPKFAELRVCDVEQFPRRVFNPEWLQAIDSGVEGRDVTLMQRIIEVLLRESRTATEGVVVVSSQFGTTALDVPIQRGHRIRVFVDFSEKECKIRMKAGARFALVGIATAFVISALSVLRRRSGKCDEHR